MHSFLPAPCALQRIHSPSRLSLSWIIEGEFEREGGREERERKREMRFSRALRSGVRCTPREKSTGREERAAAPRRKEEEEEEEEDEDEEVVGLRASPARVGAYIDHERVYDIREYIIRGL